MRLATVLHESATRAARVEGNELVLLPAKDLRELLQHADWRKRAAANGQRQPLDLAKVAPPVPAPDKILCLGLNFREHIAEAKRQIPEFPALFAKFPGSLTSARGPIVLPHRTVSVQNDWEIELCVVVQGRVRNADPEQARQHIAGFTISNDISVRDWQARNPTVLTGKVWESSTPVGPWMTTPDELGDMASLELVCEVDGQVVQRGLVGDMVFAAEDVISYASAFITLEPGDLILMGTPAGTAMGRTPSPWLRPGQKVTSRISKLGELVNECVEGPAPATQRWLTKKKEPQTS
jgi:acylpyruvate hydrolase